MKSKRQVFAKPRPLKQGANIAFAAPSSHFRREHFDEVLAFFITQGFEVSFQESVFDREHYLAGSDERRLSELQMFLKAPNIDAIFLLRGGFGAARMFRRPLKKFSLSHPKFLLGMSDHTLLLNYISKQNKLVTYHMPIITSELFRSLSNDDKKKMIASLQKKSRLTLQPPEYQVLQPGNAKGKLWGGNMSILQTTFATPFENSWKDSILFLEDNNEMEYRIDRIFAHFHLTGHLEKISGLILGDFTDKENKPHSRDFLKRIVDRYVPKNIPVLFEFKAGHMNGKMIVPIGGEVSISNRGNKLVFDSLV